MTSSNIYIFSRAIRTGKTTELLQWVDQRKNAAGILTPDIDGKRKLLDIASGRYYNLELDASSAHIISVGRFHFDSGVFEDAQQLLLSAALLKPEWLVVDEVGKLEIEQNTGLEPALSDLIKRYKTSGRKLLLVVRDSLLDKAIAHYGLEEATVIHRLDAIS